jgi:serine/threonine-protein kinase RsbW
MATTPLSGWLDYPAVKAAKPRSFRTAIVASLLGLFFQPRRVRVSSHQEEAGLNEISLSVPARGEFVHVLRSVLAGVAAKLDFSFDEIEDLRLAVDEACAYLLELQDEPEELRLTINPQRSTLEVLATVDGSPSNVKSDGLRATVIWHLLGALTDEARFEEADGRPGIRFHKRVAGTASL